MQNLEFEKNKFNWKGAKFNKENGNDKKYAAFIFKLEIYWNILLFISIYLKGILV